MKQPLLFLTLTALSVLSTLSGRSAAYRDEVSADQPVGYWRLGDAADATIATNSGSLGSGGDGMLVNGVSLGVPGALASDTDTSAYLDGLQSKIEVPYAPELNPSVFTIEAWAMVTSDSSGYRSPLASRDDSPQKGFIFYADPNFEWQFWTGTGEQVGWDVVGGATAQADLWDHLVGTFDGTNKLFYVNGVLVGADQSRVTPNAARVLRIGASATEGPVGDFFFVGGIDEVAVYNKVLGADRVVAHFKAGSGADPSQDFAPILVVQPPMTLERFKGETVTLTAIATGSLPLGYQWKKDDAPIDGAIGSSLTLTNVQPGDSGTYIVEVSNTAGTTPGDPVQLSVSESTKPVITRQPRSRTVLPGSPASFSVAAMGSTEFDYQWQHMGSDLDGETNATLTLPAVQTADLGTYKVIVTNPAGPTESDEAVLQFPQPATNTYAETIRQDTPVAYWRLGESTGDVAADEIGNNDGAYLNGVTLGRPGAPVDDPDTAAGFTTANQTKVDVPWSDALNPATFTVECWAKITGGTGQYRSPLTSRADLPQRGYIFYATPADVWQFWAGAGESGWVSLSGPAVQTDSYAHLVGVYDGATLFFYVNGVLVAQQDAVVSVNDANPLRIGGGATEGDGDFFFEGDIDEVAVYNTALGEDRILAHYVAGYPLTTPPSIIDQPGSQVVPPGATVTFAVNATGGLPLEYQWTHDTTLLSGAISSSLTLSNVMASATGDYRVIITNAGGSITSEVATLTIPAPPTQAYADLVKSAAPVAYWRLGETSGDVAADSIDGNDGAYLEGVTLGVPGAIPDDTNAAAHFSSDASQKVDVPWSDVLNPPVFSAEVWARVTGGTGNYRSPLTSRADNPQRGYIFYAEPGDTWQFWSGQGDTSGWNSIPGPAVQTNQWTYLAATYDGTTKRFFVNGVQVGTSTTAFGINDEGVLRIGGGASEGPGNYFFEGDVDEVAVYDKVLTPEQVVLHFLSGSPVVAAPELSVNRQGGDLILTWTSGTLESADTVNGTWTTVTDAASPMTVSPAGTARFFRVRQ